MKNTLGAFEGKKVEAAELEIRGGSDDRVGTIELGETVYFVGKATVSKVTHGDVKDTFSRSHTATASSMVILEPSDGERMLSEAQMLADDRFGIANLFAQAGAAVGHDPDTGEIDDPKEH